MNEKLYVGNLPFTATESELRALFEPYGTVRRVDVITERDTGRPRGFAFVEMVDAAGAESAARGLEGRSMNGRTLRVNAATGRVGGDGRSR